MSKFILLLHEGPNAFPPDISPDQIQAIIQRYVAWRQKVQQNGRKVEGHKLTDGAGAGDERRRRDPPGSPTALTRKPAK